MMGFSGITIRGTPLNMPEPAPPVTTYIKEVDGITNIFDVDGNPIEEV